MEILLREPARTFCGVSGTGKVIDAMEAFMHHWHHLAASGVCELSGVHISVCQVPMAWAWINLHSLRNWWCLAQNSWDKSDQGCIMYVQYGQTFKPGRRACDYSKPTDKCLTEG